MKKFAFAMLLGIFAGCFSESGQAECDVGSMGCECTADATCLDGLTCVGGLCQAGGTTSGEGTADGPDDDGPDATDDATDDGRGSTSDGGADTTTSSSDSSSDDDAETDSGDSSDSTSTGVVGTCDNGVLDPDEECDGGPGCTDCELDNFDCNPLNDGGCDDNDKCTYTERGTFVCIGAGGPGAVGEPCSNLYTGYECDPGLGCEGSCGGSFCCTEYCDLDGELATCGGGLTCEGFWLTPQNNLGLEWLGSCY